MIQKRAQFNIKRIYSSIRNTEKKFNKVDEWSIPRDRFSFYLTHDFHPYFAAFPPELVKRLLDRYSKEGDVFLDPFMGGGSAIVEGFRLKRRVMGVEISPFAKFISEVKVTPIKINKKKNSNLLSQIKNDVSKQRFNSYRDFDYKIPDSREYSPDRLCLIQKLFYYKGRDRFPLYTLEQDQLLQKTLYL